MRQRNERKNREGYGNDHSLDDWSLFPKTNTQALALLRSAPGQESKHSTLRSR
jgi:hypothetical protein